MSRTGSPPRSSVQSCLAARSGVWRVDAGGGVRNRVRWGGVGLVALERQDVATVSASKAIDGVVRHQSVGDKIVRPLDVDVLYGLSLHCASNVLHHVDPTTLIDHQHSGPDGTRRSELEC